MKQIKLFSLLIALILLAILLMPVPFYEYDHDQLPVYGVGIDDVYVGYDLLIPPDWYGGSTPETKININTMLFDVQNYYGLDHINFPLDVNLLRDGNHGDMRVFFVSFNEAKVYADFLPVGFLMIVKDSGLSDSETIRSVLGFADWELMKTWSNAEWELKSGGNIHLIEGLAKSRNFNTMYIKILYFRTDYGLVVIPAVSPVEQRLMIQTLMKQIIKSLGFFRPQLLPTLNP